MAFQAAFRGVRHRGVGNGGVRIRQMVGYSRQLLGSAATEPNQCMHRAVSGSVGGPHRLDYRMFLDQIPKIEARGTDGICR